MANETDPLTAWGPRLRELEQQLSQAWVALEQRLLLDWQRALAASEGHASVTLGAPGRTDPYFEYGRLSAKVGRDPRELIAALRGQVETWRVRAAQEARAALAHDQGRVLALATRDVPALGARWLALTGRQARLRQEFDAARMLVKLLAALIPLSTAIALIAAEFSLATQVTSQALGLEYAALGGASYLTPVNLFAVALCALTLPFKLLADIVEDRARESLRWRWWWTLGLVVMSLVLVGAVGWMRGDISYSLREDAQGTAAGAPVTSAGGGGPMPPPPESPALASATPTSPAPASAAEAGAPLYYLALFMLAGALFPTVGGVALSKAQRPTGEVIRSATASLALYYLPLQVGWTARRLRKRQIELGRECEKCLRWIARIGPDAGLGGLASAIAHELRGSAESVADDLERFEQERGPVSETEAEKLRRVLAQARVGLAPGRQLGVQPLLLLATHALDAADGKRSLEHAADQLLAMVAGRLRDGYSSSRQTAAELLADVSAEGLYRLETWARFHAEFFRQPAADADVVPSAADPRSEEADDA